MRIVGVLGVALAGLFVIGAVRSQQLIEQNFALADRFAPKIFAVELEQIKCIQLG